MMPDVTDTEYRRSYRLYKTSLAARNSWKNEFKKTFFLKSTIFVLFLA